LIFNDLNMFSTSGDISLRMSTRYFKSKNSVTWRVSNDTLNMTPRPATGKLGDPLDQQSQYTYFYMGLDTPGGPVIHRSHFNLGPLERTETPLYHHQSLVAAGCILKADSVIVGLNYPLAVVLKKNMRIWGQA